MYKTSLMLFFTLLCFKQSNASKAGNIHRIRFSLLHNNATKKAIYFKNFTDHVFLLQKAKTKIRQIKLENVSESIHVVNTFIIGAQQYRIGAINQFLLVLNISDSISIIKKDTTQFTIHNSSNDHPNNWVKILRKVEYVIKCPPYVPIAIGSCKLPIVIASTKNEDG